MNKHTPGEWRVRNNSIGGPLVSSDSGTIADVRTCGGVHVGGPQHPETIANARLLAAAPDLLEALKELADCGAEAWGEDRPCVKWARAAIAKATGEQP